MLNHLKAVPLFADLGAEELNSLAQHVVIRTFPKHAVIVTEGDRSDSWYIILSGRVKVYASEEDGGEVVLTTQGPGEYFGEMVLDEGPRSASVMTLEPSTLAIIPNSEFKGLLIKHPDVAIYVVQQLIRRARALTENVKSLALLDVYGRVAHLLLSLASEHDGKLVIVESLTHQDIANRVGASREMISRILKDLSLGGYIKVDGRKITINKKPPPRW